MKLHAILSLLVAVVVARTPAAPSFVAPADPDELGTRILELREQYAPYLRSLPDELNVRRQRVISGGWEFRFEASDVPKGTERPEAPAWYGRRIDRAGWETTTVPQWRYRRGKTGTVLGGKNVFGWGARGEHSNIAWYRTTFEAAEPAPGRRLWLCFDGVDWEAEVYLNGERLGTHRVRYEPFRFDVTDKVRAENTLAVRVVDGRVFGEPHAFWTPLPDARAEEQIYVHDAGKSLKGVLPIGYHGGNGFGIHRDVRLEETGPVLVSAIFARNDLSAGEVRVKVELDAAQAGTYGVRTELLPENFEGRAYSKTSAVELQKGESAPTVAIPMPEAKAWSPDAPNLYRCRVTVLRGTQTVDIKDVLFGCRSFTLHHTGPPTSQAEGPPPVYAFKPVRAKWLRVLGRGSDKTEWNSIWEVACDAIVRDPKSVKASKSHTDYPATLALDGKPDTRWAVQGRGEWIQFKLDDNVTFDRIEIGWYEAWTRRWDFDILVSVDGERWTKVDYRLKGRERADTARLPNGMPLLNGKPCYLRGTNIHGLNAYWYWGQQDELLNALLLLKAANFNIVRVCQHTQFPEVRELLDRVGMMSGQEQGSGYRHQKNGLEPHIMKQLIDTGRVLARETYNNPGVVMLTFGNECHFDATEVVKAVLAEDPQRIVKPISGRLSHGGRGKAPLSDEALWPNVIDDTHTYSGWYGSRNPATWRMATPQRTGRLVTIGEYGGEALDAYETMRTGYPDHLKPPPPTTDTLWAASQVKKQDAVQCYGLGRKPTNLGEYIEASQVYQAALVADKTIGFRLSPRAYSGYFHFHFLDVTPSFWPKSIVSCDQRPKQAYYAIAQVNQPVVALPQFTGKKPDAMTIWVCNDLPESITGCTVTWQVAAGDRKTEGSQQLAVPAIDAVQGETVDLEPATSAASVFDLTLTLRNAQDKVISVYRRSVRRVPDQRRTQTPGKPPPETVKDLLRRVNAYQLAHPWKATDRNWIRATYYTGVMAAYRATGEKAYAEQAMRWAEKHNWQVGNERSGANVLTCGQTYLQLHEEKRDAGMIRPLVDWLESGKPNTPTGADVWYLEGGRRYADSLYVGPPTLAMLAATTGESKYLHWMHAFFWDIHRELYDDEENLFYRDKRFIAKEEDKPASAADTRGRRKSWVHTITHNRCRVLWSRGNGWVFAGIARILQYLPKDDPQRPRYETLFKDMAMSLLTRQRTDGLWRANLDDPQEYPMPETSGTGFFCYGLAWGINAGILDRDGYETAVYRAWQGLTDCVSADGKVRWGQPVAAGPYEVHEEDSHEYVTGTFLLAGSEVLKLVSGEESPR